MSPGQGHKPGKFGRARLLAAGGWLTPGRPRPPGRLSFLPFYTALRVHHRPACLLQGQQLKSLAPSPRHPALQVLRQPGDCYCVLLHADVARSWSLPAACASAAAATGGPADAAAAGVEAQPSGRHSSRDGGEGSRGSDGGAGRPSFAQADKKVAAVMFSGFVSHAQLTGALGGQLAGDAVRQVLRAAAAAARGQPAGAPGGRESAPLATCRVSMRGPGGRGAADVAVSSYLPQAGEPAPGAAGGSTGAAAAQPSRPNLFERASLLARGMAAAAKQAAAGPNAAGGAAGVPVEELQLRCALMALQVPVDMLASAILQAL